jgi:hypothetical protein
MIPKAAITLTIELDMRLAMRLARYEVVSGMGLGDLLVEGVGTWEASHLETPREVIDRRQLFQFTYKPRQQSKKWVATGSYDAEAGEIEITHFERPSLIGFRGRPSTVSAAVVVEVNPAVDPNRNGLRDWREVGTGRALGDIARHR